MKNVLHFCCITIVGILEPDTTRTTDQLQIGRSKKY
jgi:hypothetical protein